MPITGPSLQMTAYITTVLVAMFAHFIADFVVQTNHQALHKSHNFGALLRHIGTYTLTLFLIMWLVMSFRFGEKIFTFAIVNGFIHLLVDFFSSKGSSYFFHKEDWHHGFVVIGFDQYLHHFILIITCYSLSQVWYHSYLGA